MGLFMPTLQPVIFFHWRSGPWYRFIHLLITALIFPFLTYMSTFHGVATSSVHSADDREVISSHFFLIHLHFTVKFNYFHDLWGLVYGKRG